MARQQRQTESRHSNRTILFSYAHPDDESFGPGGTIARYADAGVNVVLVCATLGEAGKAGDPPICTPEELPEVRRKELLSAAEVLGIGVIELLGYRDKELNRVDFDDGVAQVENMLHRYDPEAVVTFPPGGISGHPDHWEIQQWTLEAVRRYRYSRRVELADSSAAVLRLYYNTAPEYFSLYGLQPHHELDGQYNVRVAVKPWLDRKIQALRCHRSQHLSAERLLAMLQVPPSNLDHALAWEHYLHIDPDNGSATPPPHADSLLDPPIPPFGKTLDY